MTDTPLISVIIPVYNTARYLPKCIESVCAQTYPHLEIILIDDGSMDDSRQIAQRYAQQDPRIHVICQANAGVSVARNKGLAVARGQYVSFVDSDDWIAPTFLETLWQLILRYHAPVSQVGQYQVFAHTMKRYHITKQVLTGCHGKFSKQEALHMISGPYGYHVTNKLFRKDLFKDTLFPPGLFYEDVWILYRLFQQIDKIVGADVPLFYYNRQNENSVSRGKFSLKMLDYFKVTDEFIAQAKQLNDTALLHHLKRDRLAHICGFFKRMMLGGFNDPEVILPLQRELRRNLWLLLLKPRPLKISTFGITCAINFQLAKRILLRQEGRHKK